MAAGDAVLSTNFALASGGATIVAPPPQMTGAVAPDASVLGQGIQAGDQVMITFDSATNALPITALNIDNVLALNNGHTWRDATAAIGSALWSTGTNANDTLTITLSTGTLAPTVAPGDTITIPPASIQDATGNSNAVGSPPSLSGDFGADSIIVTPASLSPAVVNVDAGLVLMGALTFTSLTNDAVVTALRIDRLGTATDSATPVNGVHVYHVQDGDRVLDAGEPLLGSGSFLGGTVTITTPLVVLQGIPQSVLIAVTVQGGAGKTIGVALLNTSYVQVAAGDAVGSTNFGIVSTVTSIAGPSPQMTGAVATDVSALGEGVHAGDTVAVVFDGATNSFAVTAASIDGVLTLSSGHSWLDGGGAIGSAVWSTSTFTNDTLTIALTTSVSAPTVAAGDTITIGASSIADITGTNAALGSPPSITGTFGRDTLTVTGTSLAPSQIQPGASGVPLLQLTVTADRNNVALAGFTFTLTGTATASDFATTGLTVVSDVNSSGTFDAGDVTLATAAVSGTSISIPLTLTVVNGTSPALLVIANLAATAVVGRTLGLELTDASAVTVGGADAVTPDGYPIGSTDATIVGLEPVMIAAVALDASSDGGGVQTGDQVVIVFSAATNGFAITAANIEATLALSESHGWLSGSGALVSAVWSAGVAANDTLTLTLSAAGGAPTIAVGDTISIAGSTIADASGIRFAASTPRPMIGSFGEGAETTVGVVVLSGIAAAQADSLLTSASAAHRVQVPAAAAGGGGGAGGTGDDGAARAAAGGPADRVVTLPGRGDVLGHRAATPDPARAPGCRGGGAVGGACGDTGHGADRVSVGDRGHWRLLPSWVDRERSELHVAVAGNATLAIAAVTPRTRTLEPGWNLVPFVGAPGMPVAFLFAGLDVVVDAIHVWDASPQSDRSAFPLAPSFSTLSTVQPLDTLWVPVRSDEPVEWAQYGAALPAITLPRTPGWMLLPWLGAETPVTDGVADLFGVAPAVFRWNAETGAYDAFYSAGPAPVNTLTMLQPLDGLWIVVSPEAEASWIQPGLGPGVPSVLRGGDPSCHRPRAARIQRPAGGRRPRRRRRRCRRWR